LEPQVSEVPLCFNVTHAEDMALYAVARARAIGIDIEAYRQLPDATAIAERFFSPLENRTLRALPVAEQALAFLRCWTRKEAYIKAQGMGLSLPLNQFSVTLVPGEPARLLHTNHDPVGAGHWALQDLAPAPGYVAALAVEGNDWQPVSWQWQG
jgi:4'-phosphopantetheinyl transferase